MDLLEYLKQQAQQSKKNHPLKEPAKNASTPGTPTGVSNAYAGTGTAWRTPNPRKITIPTFPTSQTVSGAGANTRTMNPVTVPSVHGESKWTLNAMVDAIINLFEWQERRMEWRKECRIRAMIQAQQNRQNRDKVVENKGLL